MMLARSARLVVRQVASTGTRSFSAVCGENVSLNWSLCGDDITPMNNAFRNLPTKALVKFGTGSKGPNGSLVVTPGSAPSSGDNDAESVVDTLSNVDNVFVVDAAVGSHRGSEIMVRAVTDSANVALFLQHLLVATGGSSDETAGEFHPIKVFHQSQGQPSISTTVGEANATIVATGDISFGAVQEAITQATHVLMEAGEDEVNVLPLPGLAVLDKSGDTVVEIDVKSKTAAAPIGAPAKGSELYGAHGSVWSDAGLARLYGGAVLKASASTPAAGDLVVGDNVVTSFRADNLVAHPSKIVFVGGSKKASAKDFAKVARSQAEVEKFEALVAKHNVKLSSR